MLADFQVKELEDAFARSMSGEKVQGGEYLLYGEYDPLSVTLTHLLNGKAGLGWTSYKHTGVPVSTSAVGVGCEALTAATTTPTWPCASCPPWASSPSRSTWRRTASRSRPTNHEHHRQPGGAGLPSHPLCLRGTMHTTKANRHDFALVLIFALFSIALYFVPTGFAEKVDTDAVRCTARVAATDDSEVGHFGLIRKGEQGVTLDILDGPFEGRRFDAHNQLLGQLDRDKLFRPGDTAYVVITVGPSGEVLYVNPQAHYRIGLEMLLLGLFTALLVIFGGVTGLKALLSFIFTGMTIWKVMVPLMLKGVDPVWLALGVITLLCAVIIFLVAGVNRTGLTAFFGAFLGVLTSCALAVYFTSALHVHGAVMPFAETLLYSGYSHLDLTRVLCGGGVFGLFGRGHGPGHGRGRQHGRGGGAQPRPVAGRGRGIGIRVGRAVVGTMTTTLLLAYSGGYVTLLMAFMAQGIPLGSTFNFIYVAAEVLKTLVGSFGLVTVAPFTAMVGGLLLAGRARRDGPVTS